MRGRTVSGPWRVRDSGRDDKVEPIGIHETRRSPSRIVLSCGDRAMSHSQRRVRAAAARAIESGEASARRSVFRDRDATLRHARSCAA